MYSDLFLIHLLFSVTMVLFLRQILETFHVGTGSLLGRHLLVYDAHFRLTLVSMTTYLKDEHYFLYKPVIITFIFSCSQTLFGDNWVVIHIRSNPSRSSVFHGTLIMFYFNCSETNVFEYNNAQNAVLGKVI